jgi:hypothetical protein
MNRNWKKEIKKYIKKKSERLVVDEGTPSRSWSIGPLWQKKKVQKCHRAWKKLKNKKDQN